MRRPKRRHAPGINPSSMADIGFLLIILFLSITAVYEETTGIAMKLPPWTDEVITCPPSGMPVPFRIDINSENKIMANDQVVEVREVKLLCKVFIEDHVSRGEIFVIQFRTNRYSSYEMYIEVLNEIKAVFNELWNNESQRLFEKNYNQIYRNEKRIVRDKYPFAVIEKEADFYLYTF